MRRIVALFALLAAPVAPALAVPVQTVMGAPLPDFARITFDSLPPVLEGGEIAISDPQVLALLGYDPSRRWSAGTPAATVMMLGDLAGAFGLERLNLTQIAVYGGVDLTRLRLDQLPVLAANTVADIVAGLGYQNLSPAQVPLLRDIALRVFQGRIPYGSLAELIARHPPFAQALLGSVDLARYGLAGLPGLERTALDRLTGWASQTIRAIPGLARVPFAAFPLFPTTFAGIVARLDLPLAAVEQNRTRTISGSDVEGFAVACARDCLHIEWGDPLKGRAWIGKTQTVRGGHGALASVNNGREPTGRLPYGPWAKLVLTAVDERRARAEFGLYFRVCLKTAFVDLGCTPYFIGPVPWLGGSEKTSFFVGP